MPTAKASAQSKTKPRHAESISDDRLELLKRQYQSLATFEATDEFLSQLTFNELKALMAATGSEAPSLANRRNGISPSLTVKGREKKLTQAMSARYKTNERQELLRRHIIRSEYQSLKTDKARDRFLDRLSSSELHTLMVATLDVDLLKERLGS
jgi:hypothetical protein